MKNKPGHKPEGGVFVLSKTRELLRPCFPAYARKLLREKKAAVYSMKPFAIILTDEVEIDKPTHINIEINGSEITVMGDFDTGPACVYKAEKNTGFLRNFRFQEPRT